MVKLVGWWIGVEMSYSWWSFMSVNGSNWRRSNSAYTAILRERYCTLEDITNYPDAIWHLNTTASCRHREIYRCIHMPCFSSDTRHWHKRPESMCGVLLCFSYICTKQRSEQKERAHQIRHLYALCYTWLVRVHCACLGCKRSVTCEGNAMAHSQHHYIICTA